MSREEFAAFYEASNHRCLRAALAQGMSRADAEEAVAEAFARAWASWRNVRKSRSPAAWVVRTAINSNISQWRKTRREFSDGGLVQSEGDDGPAVAEPETAADLIEALQRLPQRQREVVILRYLLDLDSATTADWLGISPGTVGAHLHHALKSLRTRLVEPNGAPS